MLRDVWRASMGFVSSSLEYWRRLLTRLNLTSLTAFRHSNGNDLIPIYPPSTIID